MRMSVTSGQTLPGTGTILPGSIDGQRDHQLLAAIAVPLIVTANADFFDGGGDFDAAQAAREGLFIIVGAKARAGPRVCRPV
jgi:hypothetical protein